MYAYPWQGGWRLRDSVKYVLTASTAVLDYAAKYTFDVLYNRYQAGRDVMRTHRTDPPFACFIRQQQRDPVAAVEMLRRLAFNGGMPSTANLMVGRSPVFTTEEEFEGRILAKYAKEGSPLLSGYLLGEEHMQGYAAALEVQHGDGRVLLFGFRPQWRGQPFGTFKIPRGEIVPEAGELLSRPSGHHGLLRAELGSPSTTIGEGDWGHWRHA